MERSSCEDDRRSVFVCLTPQGRKVYDEALPTHRAVLEGTWS